MDLVLFLWQAAQFQSMELERVEGVHRIQSSSRSRLWSTGGSRAGRNELAAFGVRTMCQLAEGTMSCSVLKITVARHQSATPR
jgi:hypothetical protein